MCITLPPRREAERETLREKLDLEKRPLQAVECLLEDSVVEDFLVDCVSTIEIEVYKYTVPNTRFFICGWWLRW